MNTNAVNPPLAEQLRGFGPLGILAIVAVVLAGNVVVAGALIPLGALLVLAWARLSRTSLAEIGYSRPRSWVYTIVVGIALGVALKLLMKAVVMPLFGAPPMNAAYQYLAGNRDLIIATLWTMLIVGFAEETVWRGFLFERMRRVLGGSRAAIATILGVSSLLFGLAHYGSQGWPGVQQAVIVGLAYGGLFLWSRSLWLPIVTHSAFDLTAYALIYWRREVDVATLFFN
jgi:membrane protease YdiL (CAAX protease family)